MIESSLGIRLLDAEPGIGQFLSEEEREGARRIVLPTHTLPKGDVDMCALLEEMGSFAAIVLEGMLLQRLRLAGHVGLRLLGPGDVMSLTKEPRSMLLSYADCQAVSKIRVALLGGEVLAGAQRWPRLFAGVHVRVAEQADRLAAQLVICQLSRVDQRLLAILWLLAESWGHVTSSGTFLPVTLTHDLLGGLVGARRSTVTLALGELAERGAIIRQDGGWLLIEPPPIDEARLPDIDEPRLHQGGPSVWGEAGPVTSSLAADLIETVARLREEHVAYREQVKEQLARLRRARMRDGRTPPA
jgi:CRP/FNR family transcriptional regulator, cyclic AMP receptor protein